MYSKLRFIFQVQATINQTNEPFQCFQLMNERPIEKQWCTRQLTPKLAQQQYYIHDCHGAMFL